MESKCPLKLLRGKVVEDHLTRKASCRRQGVYSTAKNENEEAISIERGRRKALGDRREKEKDDGDVTMVVVGDSGGESVKKRGQFK